MELHHLRHFVAVAEELHFGRAATRLGMQQPPLSQSIRRLEASLGIPLFDRSRRRVVLLPAGRVLLEEARRVLSQIELAQRLTLRAATSGVKRLRIGFAPVALFTVLPQVVKAFRTRWPGVEIVLHERPTFSQIPLLINGNQDLGILYRHGPSAEGLTMKLIERSNYVLALPTTHALARRKEVSLAELAEESFVSHDPELNPDAYAMFNAACRTAGFVPSIAQYANQTYTVLSLVANEVGIALVGDNARYIGTQGVALVPITGVPDDFYQETVLAWAPWARSQVMSAFVALFEQLTTARKVARPRRGRK